MKILSIPGLFGIGMGIFGLAVLADGMTGGVGSSVTGNALLRNLADGATAAGRLVTEAADITAQADDTPPQADLSDLLRIDDPRLTVRYGDTVSRRVLTTSTVRKIGYGRVSEVTIATTPTGTYSTNALASPHIQYPGIALEKTPGQSPSGNLPVLIWEPGFGWLPHGDKLVTYSGTLNGGKARIGDSGTCISEGSFRYCN